MFLAFVKNKDRPPTGWRYSNEVTGLAKVLQTLLSDSEYDKVGRLLPGCLPTSRHLRDRFSLAPSVEGFQLSQFAKLKATWIHQISVVGKVSVAKAAQLLQQAPFAALADDETSVRQAFRYQPDADHIIGPIHDNVLHRWLPIPIETFVEAKAKHQLADKANCYVIKSLAFPQLPAFLLAVVPTYRGNAGDFALTAGVTAEIKAREVQCLAAVIAFVCDIRIISYGCDGLGQASQTVLRSLPGETTLGAALPNLLTEHSSKNILAFYNLPGSPAALELQVDLH